MAVMFVHQKAGAPDLHRRGMRPETASSDVLLTDVEADLVIRDGDCVVWSETSFPVAELACALTDWLRQPDDERGDFAFQSMSYAEVGAVRIEESAGGWRVGSVFLPDTWAAPVGWDFLVAAIRQFVSSVRQDVADIGIDPALIPAL
ncbi:hypothetical protein ABT119_29985 [Streptomyces sp. NPDC001910]|uniref:DUF7878 domain-containing protein n=1 Tax=Streptomyces sp. NPDC001910 TaxID=3154403 RepID=UPI00332761D5